MLKFSLVFVLLFCKPMSAWCETGLPLEKPFNNAMFDRPYLSGPLQTFRKIKSLPLLKRSDIESGLIFKVIRDVQAGVPDLSVACALFGSEAYNVSLHEIEREYILKDFLRAVLLERVAVQSERRARLNEHMNAIFPAFVKREIEYDSRLEDIRLWFGIWSTSDESKAEFYKCWPKIREAFYSVVTLLKIRESFDLAKRYTLRHRMDEVLDLTINQLMSRATFAQAFQKTRPINDYLAPSADDRLLEQFSASFSRMLSPKASSDLQRALHLYIDRAPISLPYGDKRSVSIVSGSQRSQAQSLLLVKRAHVLSCKRALKED